MEKFTRTPPDIIRASDPDYQKTGLTLLYTPEARQIPASFLEAFNTQLRKELGLKPEVMLTDEQKEFAKLRSGVYMDAVDKGTSILEQKLQKSPLVVPFPDDRVGNYTYEFKGGQYHWRLTPKSTSLIDRLNFRNAQSANLPSEGTSDITNDYYLALEALNLGLFAQNQDLSYCDNLTFRLKEATASDVFNLMSGPCGVGKTIDNFLIGYELLNDPPQFPNPLETSDQTKQRLYFVERKNHFQQLKDTSQSVETAISSVLALCSLFRYKGVRLASTHPASLDFDVFLNSLGYLILARPENIPEPRYIDPAVIEEDIKKVHEALQLLGSNPPEANKFVPNLEIFKIITHYHSIFSSSGINQAIGNSLLRSSLSQVERNSHLQPQPVLFAVDSYRRRVPREEDPSAQARQELNEMEFARFKREVLSDRIISFDSYRQPALRRIIEVITQGAGKEPELDLLLLATLNKLGLSYSPAKHFFRIPGKTTAANKRKILSEILAQLDEGNQAIVNILRSKVLETEVARIEPKKFSPLSLQAIHLLGKDELAGITRLQARLIAKKILYDTTISPVTSEHDLKEATYQTMRHGYATLVSGGYHPRYAELEAAGIDMSDFPPLNLRYFSQLTEIYLQDIQTQLNSFERSTFIPDPQTFLKRVVGDSYQLYNTASRI